MATKLSSIVTWSQYSASRSVLKDEVDEVNFRYDPRLNEKISLLRGDITTLEVDVVVNAANPSLLGGRGVDGAIHRAAGPLLLEECKKLNGCLVGQAKLTDGYDLPARKVIHAVGSLTKNHVEQQNVYESIFNLFLQTSLKSIAIPCIGTAIYGYPREEAAHIALLKARQFLDAHHDEVDRVVFCVFADDDEKVYEKLLQRYFPIEPRPCLTVEELRAYAEKNRHHCDVCKEILKERTHAPVEMSVFEAKVLGPPEGTDGINEGPTQRRCLEN